MRQLLRSIEKHFSDHVNLQNNLRESSQAKLMRMEILGNFIKND